MGPASEPHKTNRFRVLRQADYHRVAASYIRLPGMCWPSLRPVTPDSEWRSPCAEPRCTAYLQTCPVVAWSYEACGFSVSGADFVCFRYGTLSLSHLPHIRGNVNRCHHKSSENNSGFDSVAPSLIWPASTAICLASFLFTKRPVDVMNPCSPMNGGVSWRL